MTYTHEYAIRILQKAAFELTGDLMTNEMTHRKAQSTEKLEKLDKAIELLQKQDETTSPKINMMKSSP